MECNHNASPNIHLLADIVIKSIEFMSGLVALDWLELGEIIALFVL